MSNFELITLIVMLLFCSPIIILGVYSICLEEYQWIIRTKKEIKELKK